MTALWYFGAYMVAIVVHECGHYVAGRALDLPPGSMRIELLRGPPHVALRSGDGRWVSPTWVVHSPGR